MKNRIRKIRLILSVLMAAVLIFMGSVTVWAADAYIGMSSANTGAESGTSVVVTAEITSDSQIGTYYVELEYDSSRLTYVSGADSGADGIATLTGTGMSSTVKYELKFTAAQGGEGGIYVRAALVNDSNGTAMGTSDSGLLSISISGQSDSSASFSQKLEEEQDILASSMPLAGTIHDQDGNTYSVVDVTQTKPDGLDFDYETNEVSFEGQAIICATDNSGVLNIVPLMDSDNNISLYAINGDMFYLMSDFKDASGNRYKYVTLDACPTMPQTLASSTDMWDYVIYAVDTDGNGSFSMINEDGNLDIWTTVLGSSSSSAVSDLSSAFLNGTTAVPWEKYLKIAGIILAAVIVLMIALSIVLAVRRRKKRKLAIENGEVEEEEPQEDVLKPQKDLEDEIEKTPVSPRRKAAASAEEDGEAPKKKKVKKADPETAFVAATIEEIKLEEATKPIKINEEGLAENKEKNEDDFLKDLDEALMESSNGAGETENSDEEVDLDDIIIEKKPTSTVDDSFFDLDEDEKPQADESTQDIEDDLLDLDEIKLTDEDLTENKGAAAGKIIPGDEDGSEDAEEDAEAGAETENGVNAEADAEAGAEKVTEADVVERTEAGEKGAVNIEETVKLDFIDLN